MTLTWGGLSGPSNQKPEGNMKHYLVLKSCIILGKRCAVGDVVELPASTGNILISMRRVEETSQPKKAPALDDRAIGLDDETAPKKRGRAKKK